MALWKLLREEVLDTVDDVKEKGVIGAFHDAALDARDITIDCSRMLWKGTLDLVTQPPEDLGAFLGRSVASLRAEPTATSEHSDNDERGFGLSTEDDPVAADAEVPRSESTPEEVQDAFGNMLHSFPVELQEALRSIQERGAPKAVADAALDVVDFVGGSPTRAVQATRVATEPLLGRVAASAGMSGIGRTPAEVATPTGSPPAAPGQRNAASSPCSAAGTEDSKALWADGFGAGVLSQDGVHSESEEEELLD
mmetsp:Transcript_522/g.1744  ORF Transcript_522/g.1744 Transcript_522/m.1744 type:complete len:253 (+) Transcript_522:67-825(+)